MARQSIKPGLNREQRRGSRKRAARDMSVPGWGKGGMHREHGRAEKYEHLMMIDVRSPPMGPDHF